MTDDQPCVVIIEVLSDVIASVPFVAYVVAICRLDCGRVFVRAT